MKNMNSFPELRKVYALFFVTISSIIIIACTSQREKELITTTFTNPLFEATGQQFQTFVIDANSEHVLYYKTGTKITIPQNAFIDKNGNVITDKVELQYREFHNAMDIFLSGIPMDYDSAGNKKILVSAGMFEFKGYYKGEQMMIDKNKTIQIDMSSQQTGNDYNIYKLDTIENKWVYQGKDSVTQVSNVFNQAEQKTKLNATSQSKPKSQKKVNPNAALIASLEQDIAILRKELIEAKKLVPPVPGLANAMKWNFQVDVDYEKFPEIGVYENAIWAIDESKREFNAELALIDWDVDVVRKEGKYIIILKKDGREEEFEAKLVFIGTSYSKAEKIYREKLSTYRTTVKGKRAEIIQKEAEIKKLKEVKMDQKKSTQRVVLQAPPTQNVLSVEQRLSMLEYSLRNANSKISQTNNAIIRTLKISSFGTWNCDRPMVFDSPSKNTIVIVDSTGNDIQANFITVVNHKVNTVYRFVKNEKNEFDIEYDSKSPNMIIAVNNENKVAVLSTTGFGNVVKTNPTFESLNLHVINYTFKEPDDFKKLFETDFDETVIEKDFNDTALNVTLELKAFPNPCKESFTISTNQLAEYKGELYSPTGTVVKTIDFSGDEYMVNISDLIKGTYILKVGIKDSENFDVTRVVVN